MGCIGEVVKNDVEELLETHEYHHDGQDLSEFPCIVDARPNVRPIWQDSDVCRVSRHLGLRFSKE